MFDQVSSLSSAVRSKNKRMIKFKTSEGEDPYIRKILNYTKSTGSFAYEDAFKEIKNYGPKPTVRASEIIQGDKYSRPRVYYNVGYRAKENGQSHTRVENSLKESSVFVKPNIEKALFHGSKKMKSIEDDLLHLKYRQQSMISRTISTNRAKSQISQQFQIKATTDRDVNLLFKKSIERTRTSMNSKPKINQKQVIHYETTSLKGSKLINQDYIKVGNNIWIVCDGHGDLGHEVSEYVSHALIQLYKDRMSKQRFTKNMLMQIFTQAEMSLQESGIDLSLSGSTCVMVVQNQNKMYCACLGDSVAVAIYQNLPYQILSSDHKPSNPIEAKRIDFFGGAVRKTLGKEHIQMSPLRIWGQGADSWGPGLAISRSFGDKMGQKYGLLYEPQIKQINIVPELKYIVLGSDGLFDQIKPSQISGILNLSQNGHKGCHLLTQIAQSRWHGYSDDVSGIVIYL